MQNLSPNIKNTLKYISYLSTFVGMGFVSGAIVHSGDIAQINKYIDIFVVGVVLYSAGSILQNYLDGEKLTPKNLIFAILLSVTVGMVSGGTQHYTDFPQYATALIPLGIFCSYIFFSINKITTKSAVITKFYIASVVSLLVLCGLLYAGLSLYIKPLFQNKCIAKSTFLNISVKASGSHDQTRDQLNCQTSPSVVEDKTDVKADINADVNTNLVVDINKTELSQTGNDLVVQIKDQNNKIITSFEENHGAKMHLIAVSKDLSQYRHLHPEYKDGKFVASYNFDQTGQYKLFVDFVTNGKNTVLNKDLNIKNLSVIKNELQTEKIIEKPKPETIKTEDRDNSEHKH